MRWRWRIARTKIRTARFLIRWFCLRNLLICGLLSFLAWSAMVQGGNAMDWLVTQELRLRTAQQRHPLQIFAAAFGLYFIACYLPGTNGKAFLVGWLFGPVLGTILINVAATLAAMGMFFGSRYFFRKAIADRYGGRLGLINDQLNDRQTDFLVVLRMIPGLPYALVNVLLGATTVSVSAFWWTTQVGMLPLNFGFAWLGASLPELQNLRDLGFAPLMNANLLLAVLFLCLLPFVVRFSLTSVRRLRRNQSSG